MFFLSGSEDDISVILNISSGYVGVSLVHFSKEREPKIIFTKKFKISISKKSNGREIEASMLKSLDEAVEAVSSEGISHLKFTGLASKKIKDIYCILSSPWYISQTRVIKVEKRDPFVFSESFLNKIIKDEEASFMNSFEKGEYSEIFKDPVQILENKTIRIKLNGYETHTLDERSVKVAEVAVYLSLSESTLMEKIKNSIEKSFQPKYLRFHTFPLVFFSVMRDLDYLSSSHLLVDIRENITDLSLVKKGLLLETITFPFGTNHLIEEFAESLNTLPQIALSYLRLYIENKTELSMTEKIKELIGSSKKWPTQFNMALKSISEEFFVPKKVYLVADPDFKEVFSEIIKKMPFEQFASDKDAFEIMPINNSSLKIHDRSGGKNRNEDVLLLLESLFINKISKL